MSTRVVEAKHSVSRYSDEAFLMDVGNSIVTCPFCTTTNIGVYAPSDACATCGATLYWKCAKCDLYHPENAGRYCPTPEPEAAPTLWNRLKNAWRVLRGTHVAIEANEADWR